jgi:large subunit ribosomal protein L35
MNAQHSASSRILWTMSAAVGPRTGILERLCHTSATVMPKMKTHSGAKKRFKLTAKGKVRGRHAFSSHILEKKSPKRKRSFRKPMEVSDHDAPRVKKLLGAKSR